MNLYKYHTNPEELYNYANRYYVPEILDDLARINGDRPEYRKAVIASKDVDRIIIYYKWVFEHGVVHNRWEEAEKVLIKSPEGAFKYAEAIGARWEDAEPMIAKSRFAVNYATEVINRGIPYGHKERWPEAEPEIIKDPQQAALYAIMLEERWKEAEPIIKTNSFWWERYQERVLHKVPDSK